MSQVIDSTVLSEDYLVGSAMSGDKSAYAVLYQRHYEPLVKKIADAFFQGKTDPARDAAQQAFLDVYHNLKDIERSQSFADSLMDVAQDRFMHHADGHEKLERSGAIEGIDQDWVEKTGTDDTDPGKISDRFESSNEQLAALETLMTLHRTSGNKHAAGIRYLFAMCEKGLSTEEIAQEENKTPAQINKAIQKACTILRPALAPLLT